VAAILLFLAGSSRRQFSEAAVPAKVTRNAKVTVPKRVRDYLGTEPGTEIAFRRAADGRFVIERADRTRPPSRLSRVIGSAGPGPSTDAIMAMLRGEQERRWFAFHSFSITLRSCSKRSFCLSVSPPWFTETQPRRAPAENIFQSSSSKRKGLQLALEPLNGRGIAGYVPKP
jgi:antitoxin PrlF